jgi:hypothetical protein
LAFDAPLRYLLPNAQARPSPAPASRNLAPLFPRRVRPRRRIRGLSNYPETGNSSYSGTFIGRDGSIWTYTACRGDRVINAPSPGLNKGTTPLASIESGTLAGGCGTLSFDYKQQFTATPP